MTEEVDALIRLKTAVRSDGAIRFTLRMSWAEVSTRVSSRRVPGLPGFSAKPVGLDEKEIKAILGSLAAMIKGRLTKNAAPPDLPN